ncbi:DUF1707 domain-containing protein [Nocardiopsis sp. SBT366]|jgi:hypothetical protein|uniref:DUF1707 SHOCT-like domain-containing protein n=1 Tax=Nocardiopsis sp. SBT366 TaxID=1580529 RepID=UPI00066D51C1|nr:DUF1707 domain-containing protein [Nocardiopsis sp. SBT366]
MAELEPDRSYRLSDTERDEALGKLRVAFEEGRLDTEEHEYRSDVALRAVNNADLVPLFDDLPRRLAPSSVAEPEPAHPSSETSPAVPDEDGSEVTEKDRGVNIGGLLGWGGFLLLVWGTPSFVSGNVYAITVFLGFFCLMVVGPLVGQLISQRRRRDQLGD